MHRSSLFCLFASFAITFDLCGCSVTCTEPPSISGQPANQTSAVGQSAFFTVAASGSAPLSYAWFKNGVAIPGATEASYVIPAVSTADSGLVFTVTVRNQFGAQTSTAASLAVTPASSGNTRFVAPTGDDSNPGTIDQPFRTIQHCAITVTQGWTCAVRAGTYRETVTPNSGITILPYNLETVVVDGSDPVTGWTVYQGAIYKAKVAMRSDDTNQVFVGSDMMTEARWPNGDDLFNVQWAIAQGGTDQTHIVDTNLPAKDWTGATIHLWSGTDPFGHQTGTVTASGSGQISIDAETGTCLPTNPIICPIPGGYYYLFGTLAALDVEREWYYDASSETLYFMAPGKVDPGTIDVRSKQRQYAFDLSGRSGVTIRNMQIFASSILTDASSTNNTLDRISAQYVSHFTSLASWANYTYENWGPPWGVLVVHASDTGIIINGTENTVQNSTISYSAGTGIALEGNSNTIRNNLIQNVDYIGDYASGIVVDGNSNAIQNNTIHNVGRQAILLNGVTNEDVGYNNLYNSMLLSSDGGEIYACCFQVAAGTRVHHNWMHDTMPVAGGVAGGSILAGIYFDNYSGGFSVDQNVFWRNKLYNINNTGANSIHNNSVPDSRSDGKIETVADCTTTSTINNRVVVRPTINQSGAASCVISGDSSNNSSAAGANEMTPSTQVGCNFDGCSSSPPPGFDGDSVSPCPEVQAPNAQVAETRPSIFGCRQ